MNVAQEEDSGSFELSNLKRLAYIVSCLRLPTLQPGEVPSVAEPRWIKLKGGKRMNKHRGDILVCFELIRKKDAETLPAYPMRPLVCMCKLSLSCLNVRDLIMAPKGKRSRLPTSRCARSLCATGCRDWGCCTFVFGTVTNG